MKAKNQLVVISTFIALIATAATAATASYIAQPAKAQCNSGAYGQNCVAPSAKDAQSQQNGGWGKIISGCAQGTSGNQCNNTPDSNGLSGQRANGCKPAAFNNGAHDNCP